jgi:hypothetical protein
MMRGLAMTRRKQDKLRAEPIPVDILQGEAVDNKLHVEPNPANPLQGDNADKKIPYDDAVEKGRTIVSSMKNMQFELGQIADQLEPKYREETLKRYAEEIGIDYGTLKSYRTTHKAWKDAPVRPPFSVAKALNRHPRRADIIQENPDITVKPISRCFASRPRWFLQGITMIPPVESFSSRTARQGPPSCRTH